MSARLRAVRSIVVATLLASCASTTPRPAKTSAGAASARLCGRVSRVLGVKGAGWERRTSLVVELDGREGKVRRVLFEHDAAVRALEEAQQVIFDDFVGRDLDRKVRVCFGGAATRKIEGAAASPLEARTINVDPAEGGSEVEIASLRPPCPAPDDRHRYLEVPVSYARPELGTFKLYYELSTGFAPGRPILLAPADGQVTTSQVGEADRMKKLFGTSLNVASFQYRGTFCSRIPQLAATPGIDWTTAAAAYRFENVIEDMERIRRALVGEQGKIMVAGGSGRAITGLAYLAKYHARVERALLMSLFKDAEGGSRSGVDYFDEFLARNKLRGAYARVVADPGVRLPQLLHVLQRLLYDDEKAAVELVQRASRGELAAIEAASRRKLGGDRIGSVDHAVRAQQLSWPHLVVFMYETNVPTSPPGQPDVNLPFLKMGEPIQRLVASGRIAVPKLDIRGLGAVSADVLLVGGTLDQATPLKEVERIRAEMPRARLAVFKTYHVMMTHKACRRAISEAFLRHGSCSPELERAVRSGECERIFVGFR